MINKILRVNFISLKILSDILSLIVDKSFRLVYKFSYLDEEKISTLFSLLEGPLPKKSRNFFLI
jgi:hypothetical protein